MKQNYFKSLLLVLMMCLGASAWAEDVVYKTATFSSSSFSAGVQNYSSSFSSTTNGFKVDVTNFNNNNKGWEYIKTGSKSSAVIGTIITNSAIDKAVSKVVVTIDAITATSVNSIKLYSGNSANTCTTEVGTFSKSTGEQTLVISSPEENKFYKISFDCKTGSNNGLVQVSQIKYYYDNSTDGGSGSDPSGPAVESHNITLNVAAGTYKVAQNVKVSNYNNSYIYAYTIDGTTPELDENLDPKGTSIVYDHNNGIDITTATTLKIVAYDDELNTSNVLIADYIIKPDAPAYIVDDAPVSMSTKTFKTSAEVEIEAAAGCNIFYTTDGTTPTTSSTAYTSAFTVTETTTLKAIAVDAYNNVSSFKTLTLTIIEGTLFAFDQADALTAWGIELPSSGAGTDLPNSKDFVADGIIVQVKKGGSTNTRIWNSAGTYDLRLYGSSSSKGSIVVTAPSGYNVSSVIFEGTTVSMSNLSSKAWKGNQPSITFEASSNQKISNITVKVVPTVATITIASACTDGAKCYSTYSNSSAWVVPAGLTVSEISIVDGKLDVEDYSEGAVVPANTGVMVSASAGGDYDVLLSNEAGTSVLGVNNALHPSSEAMAGNNLFYRLTMHNGTQIGFAWGAENGAAFSLAANKAYLAVPAGAGVKSLMWFGETETAIQGVEAENNSKVIYDLQGRRVNKAQKGLYIVNGKKVLF